MSPDTAALLNAAVPAAGVVVLLLLIFLDWRHRAKGGGT